MSDEVVQKFQALDFTERSHALNKLVFALTASERELVASSISRRTDPLYVLPVELVLQVFDHLSLFNTWTLQSVSQRWRKTLSSEDFVRSALSRWHSEDQSDSSNDTNSNGSIQSRVKHMRAVTLGIPFSEKVFDNTGTGLQGPQPKLSQRRFDFKGTKIAYISSHQGRGDAAVVCDLVSGEEKILRGEARERILLVFLTTALAGFVTFEGSLYVWQFSQDPYSDPLTQVQLPSAGVRAVGGDGDIIALVMSDHPQLHSTDSVIMYDAENGQMRELALLSYPPRGADLRSLHSCSVLVDAHRSTIDVISLYLRILHRWSSTESRKSLNIENFRISIRETTPVYQSWNIPIEFETSVRDYQYLMVPPCPTGYKDQYRITICEVPFMGGLPFRYKASVLFDLGKNEFLADDCESWTGAFSNFGVKAREMNVLWKNQLRRPAISNDWFEYIFYMNDTFMVSLEVSKLLTQHSRIRVLCFDPEVDMEESKRLTE